MFHTSCLIPCVPVVPTSSLSLTVLCVPCAQRAALVSATTTDDAHWKSVDGTASASQDGEELGVMLPWKPFAPMARIMKEVFPEHTVCENVATRG